jgi:hypothetical protein
VAAVHQHRFHGAAEITFHRDDGTTAVVQFRWCYSVDGEHPCPRRVVRHPSDKVGLGRQRRVLDGEWEWDMSSSLWGPALFPSIRSDVEGGSVGYVTLEPEPA